MKRDIQFLLDMLQSAELIMQYTAGYSKNDFVENIQLQDSVIRRLLVIAEAARRVSPLLVKIYPVFLGEKLTGCEIVWFMNMMILISILFGMFFKIKYQV